MLELLLQDSYAEWVVPLTIAVIWISGWQLFSLSGYFQTHSKLDNSIHINNVEVNDCIDNERPLHIRHPFFKTVKRKECPDEVEGPHHLLI
ncbi:hypothetical protein [Lederbergia graminis]|uniref:Uncharacterized protein n=1 Tax=Lederbergia graminis TaxID=735518 RepID=A0ABW0LHI4_9BACI|nr:hypothetical protein [Bacillaceae bacterium]